jgi:hypothetical protein
MRHRYFLAEVGSPLMLRLHELHQQRVAAHDALKAFIEEIGASNLYGNSPAGYVFDFDNAPDKQVWRKTPTRRGQYFFTTRKNTQEGKAMAERIKALPDFPRADDALRMIPNLGVGFPCVIEGGRGYSPFIRFADTDQGVCVVSIPWRDFPAEELANYQAEHAAGTHYSASYVHALWTPPEWLREVKEWEALKVIEDYTAAAVAA